MVVADVAPTERDGPASEVGTARVTQLATVAVAVIAAAPLLMGAIVAARIWGRPWTPMGDWAAMWLRADDVPTIHTPLVGAYSVRGFAHPGPSIFWIVWLLKQLSLHSVARSFALMAIVNGATLCVTVLLAKRWLGSSTALVTGIAAVAIAHSLGGRDLGDWWNPYPPVVWLFAFMVGLVALVLVGGTGTWLWTAAFGCLAAQAHVSFLILVVSASLAAAVAARLSRSARQPSRIRWVAAVPIFAVFWLPVLWDLAFGVRNLNRIKRYLTAVHKRLGFAKGLQLAARELMPWGPIASGSQPHGAIGVAGASVAFFAIVGVALVVMFMFAARDRVVLLYLLPAAAIVLVASYAATGLDGFVFDYLVTFLLGAAAVVWWLFGVAVVRHTRWAATVTVAAVLAIVVALAGTTATASEPAVLPGQVWSPIVRVAAERFNTAIGPTKHPIVLDYLDDGSGLIAPGVIGLVAAHYDVRTIDSAKFFKWGHARAYLPSPPLEGYTIIPIYPDGNVSAQNACILARRPPVVVNTTALDAAQTREFKSLQLINLTEHGHLGSGLSTRFDDLSNRSARVIIVAGLYRALC